ncbi:hypothetical protein [Duncaniella freteri]|uniref:hypothetical protein n=1 Tax=Duncaniella freteri TaxID=2530391 RepID=UPI003F66D095
MQQQLPLCHPRRSRTRPEQILNTFADVLPTASAEAFNYKVKILPFRRCEGAVDRDSFHLPTRQAIRLNL